MEDLTLSQRFKLGIVFIGIIIFILFLVSMHNTAGEKQIENSTGFVACYGCSAYDSGTNSCVYNEWSERCEANFPTDTLEEWLDMDKWYPGELTEDGLSQKMPVITGSTSHERFKELSGKYGLNPSDIWEVENKYGIKESVILCIVIAETSGGHKGYGKDGCNNLGNVDNNDRGNRRCYDTAVEGLDAIGRTLNNKYLFNIGTLGCLSNAGSCKDWDNNGHRYATSNGNWERNMVSCLGEVYSEEINPSNFIIRR